MIRKDQIPMGDPTSDNQLLPKPLSVHGMDDHAVERIGRRNSLRAGAFLVVIAGGAWCYCGYMGGPLWWSGPVLVTLLMSVTLVFRYRRSLRRSLALARTAVLEVWPDRIAYKVPGRRSFEILREDVVSLEIAGERLYIGHRDKERSVCLSTALSDFDRVYGTLRQWCPENLVPGSLSRRIRIRRWALLLIVVPLTVATLVSEDPRIQAPSAIAVAIVMSVRSVSVIRVCRQGLVPWWRGAIIFLMVPLFLTMAVLATIRLVREWGP